jgi:hypothetical protein
MNIIVCMIINPKPNSILQIPNSIKFKYHNSQFKKEMQCAWIVYKMQWTHFILNSKNTQIIDQWTMQKKVKNMFTFWSLAADCIHNSIWWWKMHTLLSHHNSMSSSTPNTHYFQSGCGCSMTSAWSGDGHSIITIKNGDKRH